MVFNSFSFAVFFAVVFALYRLVPGWSAKKLVLLLASYLFYGAWNPPIASLLAISTAVDWAVSIRMHRAASPTHRRRWLVLSLVSNLGMLGVFKYANFFLDNLVGGLAAVGISYAPAAWSIVLPVGISFYTFQTLSYTIDVYRGEIDPTEYTLLDFGLFVAFFPQLVAGPIVRADAFLPQLKRMPPLSSRAFLWGLVLLTLGIFEKSVLADTLLANTVDLVYGGGPVSVADSWAGTLAFSGQIFYDFAGYSTCAIGVAMCFGYSFMDNFWFPYGAVGFSDFWRRWHISLSSWLRDYLYVSLGGNRGGRGRTMVNLLVTMLLGGLWHGASWNFVLWGALHGIFLVGERLLRGERSSGLAFHPVAWFATQLAVLVTWVPFRAADFDTSVRILTAMAGFSSAAESTTSVPNRVLVFTTVGLTYAWHVCFRTRRIEDMARSLPSPVVAMLVALAWLAVWLAQPDDRAFIYFQF